MRPRTANSRPRHPAPSVPSDSDGEFSSIEHIEAHALELKSKLGEAKTVEQARQVIHRARMLQALAAKARVPIELANELAEVCVRAKYQMGKTLKELIRRGGNRQATGETIVRLEDLGVSKFESRQCQKLAGIPQECLDQYLRDLKATKQPIFVRSVLRWADAHASSWSLPGGNEGCRPPCGLISPQAAPSSPSDTAVIRDLRRLLADIDELLAEVRNHLATLAGILDGTGESLTVSQRGRIVGYYLAEVVVSLQRLRSFQVVLAQRVLVQTDGPTKRQGQLQGG